MTPLLVAAQNGHTEVAAALLSHGAILTATTKSGWSALHLAAKEDHIGITALLLSRGIPLEATTNVRGRPRSRPTTPLLPLPPAFSIPPGEARGRRRWPHRN